MENEFVTYKQVLALKELGFDEPCIGYYYNEKIYFDSPGVNLTGPSGEQPLPLKQQAFRWFREKYKLQAEILWRGDMECFCYKTGKFKYGSHDFSKDDYKTYEEAEQACLDKLIEIIKASKTL
jgi:hypothetical protein